MSAPIPQNRFVLYVQNQGPHTPLELLDIGENAAGFTGKSVPVAGSTAVYAKDRNGRPTLIAKTQDAPGDLPGGTITIYDKGTINFLIDMMKRGCPIMVQQRGIICGTLDRPGVYDVADVWTNGRLNTYTPGDGPVQEYAGALVTAAGELSFDEFIRVVTTTMTRMVTTETQNLLAIDGLSDEDCNECGVGYPGADRVLYIGAEADTGVAATLLASDDGSTFAAVADDAFGADEHIAFVQIAPMDENTYRVVVGTNVADAGSPAQTAWADFEYGDPVNPVGGSFTAALLGATNNETVEALGWVDHSRLYAAAAGDIFVSGDQGASYDEIFVGTVQINGFTIGPDKSVWAFGNTNLILREQNFSGIFGAGVGPSGGGNFTALAVAQDGTLIAGNGTTLYANRGNAANAGTWQLLRAFTSAIVKIQVVGTGLGYSQTLRIVTADGNVYESLDGGRTVKALPDLSAPAYTDAYFSKVSDNLMYIVGDADGGTGVIHRVSPAA